MSRHRHTPSAVRTEGRFWRQLRRINERQQAKRQIVNTAIWCAIAGVVIAGCAPTLSCSPERNESSARVIAECGEPMFRDQMVTSYGSVRTEYEYADMVVVLEDSRVLTVIDLGETL